MFALPTNPANAPLPHVGTALVDETLCPMVQAFYPGATIGKMPPVRTADLDVIAILRDDGAGYRECLRNYEHIRSSTSDDILLSIPLAYTVRHMQSGRIADFSQGSFGILSTSRPFRGIVARPSGCGGPLGIMARISASCLRDKFPRIDECFGIPMKLQRGTGRAMRALFDVALEDADLLTEAQRHSLSHLLLDAIGESLATAPELEYLKLPQSHVKTRQLFDRAVLFIFSNLGNPDLDVQSIADHCKVSTRFLRAIFTEHYRDAVVSFIREERLSRCRRDLMNSTLDGKPVANIAMTWGFTDPAYFCKLYRQRYGTTPAKDRRCNGHMAGSKAD